MKVEEFYKELSTIENCLNRLDHDYNGKRNLLNLAIHLRTKDLISSALLVDLNVIWQTRNKIMNPAQNPPDISDEITQKIGQIKAELGL